jgi:hypothetical protein
MYITVPQWENMTADVFFNCQTIRPPVDCGAVHRLSQVLLAQNRSQFDALTQQFVRQAWLPSVAAIKRYAAAIEGLLAGDQWYTLDFDPPLRNATTFATLDVPMLLEYVQNRGINTQNNKEGFL